ncbi:hypothetical protein BWI15_11935 [Kribbella sp. ALI-6-A]|nr:hypothetical protein BWI15_11935 [Kribbella sp. ALI-6-A]
MPPAGVFRHIAANALAADRTDALRTLKIPTVVIHGDSDPLVDVSGGRATADAVAGAELVVIPGMGHELPEARGAGSPTRSRRTPPKPQPSGDVDPWKPVPPPVDVSGPVAARSR